MFNPREKLLQLEINAKMSTLFTPQVWYPITFDGGKHQLRIIHNRFSQSVDHAEPEFTYRRGGIDLTRDQTADMIRRQLEHEAINGPR